MPPAILGIDFGTTNTAAAFFDAAGKLHFAKVTERSYVLPSVVWYHAADKTVVGPAARPQIVEDPTHTVFEGKRFLGRRFHSEFVTRNRGRFAYEIIAGPEGDCAARLFDRAIPFTEITQLVIRQIATLAAHAQGAPFKECVLTVPVHAGLRQRSAMRRAATRAGLKVRAIVNEPTAAALYYANLRQPEQTVLVFDFGGGTFDATLLSVQNRQVRVLATGGDAFLGGANFDEVIAQHLLTDFHARHGIDLREQRVVMQRLTFAAESAKIALSGAETTRVRIPCIAQRDGVFVDLDCELTRAQLEEMSVPLLERAASACDDVLARAGLRPEQVDELVLVGGQTRMPAIRARMRHFQRFSSEKDVQPELGVAIGAAILGRNLARGASPGLADVSPMSLSAMLPGGTTRELIPSNTPVPCNRRLPLDALPEIDAPLPVLLFESVEATSIEREVLGTVTVDPRWRSARAGALVLELGGDFTLRARLEADGLPPTEVPIVEPRAG